MTVTEAAVEPAKTTASERDWWKRRYTFTGTAVGLLFLLLSMTPSLLPRGPMFQGIVSGAAGAIADGVGHLRHAAVEVERRGEGVVAVGEDLQCAHARNGGGGARRQTL